ncbi:hypothetical protein C942_00003 [Photobacterium marinum]|uniref:Uncharacterized protein n=1 Tax=Photobacterium marinum TaxID=1056511 RepID=L8JFQ6_9GAMM|nr:hypothetical protein C942_00003 [Photobacterium marinum]
MLAGSGFYRTPANIKNIISFEKCDFKEVLSLQLRIESTL